MAPCDMHPLASQRGTSLIAWLFIIAIALMLLQLAFKIAPAYMESYAVREVLKSTASDTHFSSSLDKQKIATQIRKGFLINDVSAEVSDALRIKRFDKKVHITINYKKRIPLVKNVSLVIDFEHFLDSSQPEKCCSTL